MYRSKDTINDRIAQRYSEWQRKNTMISVPAFLTML